MNDSWKVNFFDKNSTEYNIVCYIFSSERNCTLRIYESVRLMNWGHFIRMPQTVTEISSCSLYGVIFLQTTDITYNESRAIHRRNNLIRIGELDVFFNWYNTRTQRVEIHGTRIDIFLEEMGMPFDTNIPLPNPCIIQLLIPWFKIFHLPVSKINK